MRLGDRLNDLIRAGLDKNEPEDAMVVRLLSLLSAPQIRDLAVYGLKDRIRRVRGTMTDEAFKKSMPPERSAHTEKRKSREERQKRNEKAATMLNARDEEAFGRGWRGFVDWMLHDFDAANQYLKQQKMLFGLTEWGTPLTANQILRLKDDLLSEKVRRTQFSIEDRKRVSWGAATATDHQVAADLVAKFVKGNIETHTRHVVAIDLIKEAGAECLNDLVEKEVIPA